MKTTITAHDHVTGLGLAVVAAPTQQSLEQVTTWHMARFWRSLSNAIPRPRFGSRRRVLAHA